MRIKSLYISAFGGIKNLKLDFSNGFNVIYGDNENGKSTVMAFIKMMFYGSDRGSAQIAKNIRRKYTPWDGSVMAGSIDFEHNGKNYRLEREFRSSNSTDKATLCDLDFGTRQAVGACVGVKFFGLSAAAFERSVFIGQFGYPERDSEADGEINSKLSNIVLTGEESVSFETVNSRLEKAKLALMSKSGRAGEYDKNLKLCGELKEKIENSDKLRADYERKINEIALAEENAVLMQKKAEALKKQISAEQDVKNCEKLKEFLELKEKLDVLKEELELSDGSLADEMYLGKLRFCISKVQSAQSKSQTKLQEIKALEKSLEAGLNPPKDATKENAEQLQAEIAELEIKRTVCRTKLSALNTAANNVSKERGKLTAWIVFLLSILLLSVLTGVLAFAVNSVLVPTIAASLDAVLICCFTAFAVSNRKREKSKARKAEYTEKEIYRLDAELSEITQAVFSKRVSLEAINAALNSNSAVLERQREMLKDAEVQLDALRQEEGTALAHLLDLFARYKATDSLQEVLDSIDEISQKAAKQKEIKNQLNYIIKDIGSITYDEASRKLAEIDARDIVISADFDSLKKSYDKLTEDITERSAAIAAAKASAKAIGSSIEDSQALRSELQMLTEKTARQKAFCDAADIAMTVLQESFAEVRRSYGSVLEKKAGEIFSRITDNKYGSMSISKTFDINVSESNNFGSRDIGYLSSGTADQAYLSLRIALSELMCEDKETLPLLLDDALAQYDDGRMITAIKYLMEYSEKSQIIMFTCHKSVSNTAEETGAELISL